MRRTRHARERGRDTPTRARFCNRQTSLLQTHQRQDRARRCIRIVAEDGVFEPAYDLGLERSDHCIGLIGGRRLGHDFHVRAEVVRQQRDLRVFARAEEVCDAVIDLGFAQTDRMDNARNDRFARAKPLAQKRHDLLSKHRLHLPGHAGHARDEPLVAREGDEAGRRAAGIVERPATRRQLRLLPIVRAHRSSEPREDRLHLPQRGLVQLRSDVERVAYRFSGKIVDRRPEAARHQDALRASERRSNRRGDSFAVIANALGRANVDPGAGEFARDKGRVRIHELAEQQLRAHGKDLNARHRPVRTTPDIRSVPRRENRGPLRSLPCAGVASFPGQDVRRERAPAAGLNPR